MSTSMTRYRTIPGTDQAVAFTNSGSAQSSAVGANTYAILLSCTSNVHIEIGASPVASSTTWLLKSTDPGLMLGISPGEKIAARGDSGSGTLYVVELTS
jgi:hypothetical protein